MLCRVRQKLLVWSTVVVVGALVAHACGYRFGVANQATYFLQPLHGAHPELLRHDWLVTSTAKYHTVFSIAGAVLFRLDDSGAVAFGVVHFVFMVLVVLGVFLVVRSTLHRTVLPTFLLIVGWLAVNGEHSVAGSYLWSGYLQPSLIASAGWIIALNFHVRGRPFATGIALAAGGLFHVNFLLLGIGVFAIEEILTQRAQRLRRLALLLTPQLVAVALLSPEIFAHAGGADANRSLWVLVQFHAPLHYKPSWIARTLPSLVRWIALAIVVAPVAAEYGAGVAVRRLVWWSAVAGAVCTIGTMIMMFPPLLPLTRLYVWRLAPFSVFAAQVVIAIAVTASITAPHRWRRQPLWRRAAAVVLGAWIVVRLPFMQPGQADWLLYVTVAAIAISWIVPARWRMVLLIAASIGTLAAPFWYARNDLVHPRVGIDSDGIDTDELYKWARTASSIDDVFLTPPDLFRFRLIAQRAVYADFKSPPLAPDGLIEWHARLCQMNGALPTEKIPAHRKHWMDATGEELFTRAQELGVDFLVLDRTPSHEQIQRQPVFINGTYAVYVVRDN